MTNGVAGISHPAVQPQQAMLPEQTLKKVASLLQERSGIVLGTHKEEVINRRLGAFARRLQCDGIDSYLDYLQRHPQSPEWNHFINVFTVNHTAFFREPHHFDTLSQYLTEHSRPLHLWSAAASTGEEAYSMAMTAVEALPPSGHGVHILASDIDTQAIDIARQGVYKKDRVEMLPIESLRRFFQRGTGANQGKVRVKNFLKEMIDFQVINLVATQDWPGSESMDVIFCRNTLIYFDRDTQVTLLQRFARVLKPGGLLFVGHSENFSFMSSEFRLRGQTVYERR